MLFRSRYHLLGWVAAELVPRYQAEMDLGILSEIPIYEGQLGHKNRVVQWMGGGLPVLYNRVGDLGDLLAGVRAAEGGLGLTFPAGDAPALAERLGWAAAHPGELAGMAERAQAYTLEHLTFEATTRDLVAWAAAPAYAPDAKIRRGIATPADFAPPPATMEPAPPEAPAAAEPAAIAPEPPPARVSLWKRLFGG